MARKEEQEDVEQQENDEEDVEEEESGISINITESTITIDLPRDGNEGETLGQLAKMVEGMSQ
jgi:tRNA/tmRNA/rRNA uracil-C5-methylase (TrmA/RlmC/RlmD family)